MEVWKETAVTKRRQIETDSGIQGQFNVTMYDQFQRTMRDRGWIQTDAIIAAGITHGSALELGSGPGYLGLEWLKRTQDTTLTGVDISKDMIAVAEGNAADYGLAERVSYVHTTGASMPFEGDTFDAVFSSGSLHEWANPVDTLEEMWRVLKPNGHIFVSDLRRDMVLPAYWFVWLSASPKEIRPGFVTSVNAAYTPQDLEELIASTDLRQCAVSGNLIGVQLAGTK
jgi:ubiquinone/menaquinone biosynthesis C-methylase UbiE